MRNTTLNKKHKHLSSSHLCLHGFCSIPNTIIMSTASVHCPPEIFILEGIDLLEMYYKSLPGLRSFKHNS